MHKEHVDVCIIGGGLVGCWSALFLARSGLKVVVLEPRDVGRQASGLNFGNLRLQGRNPVEYPLALKAHALWERADELAGEPVGVRAEGHAYLAFNDTERPTLEQYALEAHAAGVGSVVLDAAEVRRRWPGLSPMVVGACWSPRDGVAEPETAAPAIGRGAVRAGATILQRTRATRITRTAGGLTVSTDRDLDIACTYAINAAGAWAGTFATAARESVPMFSAGPPIIVTTAVPPLKIPSLLAVDGSVIARQLPIGSIEIATFPRVPTDAATNTAHVPSERVESSLRRAADLIPALAGAGAIKSWTGVEGYLPDMLPVIGWSGTTPGLLHAFGLSGHGYQLSAGVGAVAAELIAEGRSDIPLDAFAINRFASGFVADARLSREFDPALVGAAKPFD